MERHSRWRRSLPSSRQLKTILPLIGVLTVVMFLSVYVVPPSLEAREEFKAFGEQGIIFIIAIGRTIAFIMGASFSLIVGQWGMRMAVQANVRVASASRRGFNEALFHCLLCRHIHRHAYRTVSGCWAAL
ncbi:MAG: sodium/proton-translocating pyrophosphatase [Rheinheimera sp.]|nr:sodium/proton-translocating pyrophosphatase [Rheinheimera sp.]